LLTLNASNNTIDHINNTCTSRTVPKIKYSRDLSEQYVECLESALENLLNSCIHQLSATCAMDKLQACISHAATHVFGLKNPNSTFPVNTWYDAECKQMRRDMKTALQNPQSHVARQLQREYKTLTRRKKRLHDKANSVQLCKLAKDDSAAFWKKYRIRSTVKNSISPQAWQQALHDLFGQADTQSACASNTAAPVPGSPSPAACTQLNADITVEEVSDAFKKLKRNKAAGIDGICAEFILDAQEVLVEPLQIIFTNILKTGVYPESLATGVVTPVYKADDPDDPMNYRFITVGPVLGKLFAMILEARISGWAESNNIRAVGQAGFRKDFRTTDQCFVLRTLIEQCKHKRAPSNRVLYTCFVDFKKAFDTVSRPMLWKVLHDVGIRGDVLQCLQSMYANDTACVKTADGLTDSVACTLGVKQGCPLSPLLFGLFIDCIERRLLDLDCDAPSLAGMLVPLLLYADDLALVSESLTGLQKQLDALHVFCTDLGLTVNIAKTKALFFHQKAGTPPHQVFFAGQPVPHVDSFKYLGMEFHSSGNFKAAAEQLHAAALKALHAMNRRCAVLKITDPKLRCQLFDALVAPVLNYCCEIWSMDLGAKLDSSPQEVMHNRFLKRMLGVCDSTPNHVALAEFGRYPIHFMWLKQTLKYVRRLANADSSRLLYRAYKEQLHMQQHNVYSCWASKTSRTVLQLINKALPHIPTDLNSLHIVLVESSQDISIGPVVVAIQKHYLECAQSIDSIKNSTYWAIKGIADYEYESYLSSIGNRHHRRALSQFRTGSHWLEIQRGRFARPTVPREQRLCRLCDMHAVENENHALFC